MRGVSLFICAVILVTSSQFARSSPLEIIENNEFPVDSSEDELNSGGNSDIVESVAYQKEDDEVSVADEILNDDDNDDDDVAEVDPEMVERTVGIEVEVCDKYADLRYPLHLSHPSECTKFYKCSNGRAYLFDCPAGEEWSVKLDRCEYGFMADCNPDGTHQYKLRKVSVRAASDVSGEAMSYMDLSQDKLDKIHTILDDEDYMIADARCEVDEKDKFHPVHFAHPTNCQMFYKCFNNFAHKTSCPDSLHFNPKTEACDYPAVAKCKSSVSVQSASMQIHLPTIPDCSHGRHVNFGMQGSLTRYFMCKNGEVYLMECASDEFFNPNSMKCDLFEGIYGKYNSQSNEAVPY